jgi:hypothetical protein
MNHLTNILLMLREVFLMHNLFLVTMVRRLLKNGSCHVTRHITAPDAKYRYVGMNVSPDTILSRGTIEVVV